MWQFNNGESLSEKPRCYQMFVDLRTTFLQFGWENRGTNQETTASDRSSFSLFFSTISKMCNDLSHQHWDLETINLRNDDLIKNEGLCDI